MKPESNLKVFFIKLIAITFSIIIIINVFYNVFLSDKLEVLNKLSSLDKGTAEMIKNKIRSELESGLEKEKILSDEDAILIKKFILKVSSELK
tara:strand:- start:1514 stop:1792 length:279 start_codon:yes stop_codon:yes gene_type:complete